VLFTVVVGGCWSRRPIRTECVRRVAHGWNIDSAVGSASSGSSTPACWLERVGWERVGWCTLLGPEGPGFLLWWVSVVDARRGGGWAFGSFVGPSEG
jgi:hypothetical protein